MALNVVIFLIVGLIIAIWMLLGLKHMKHKLFAILLIALVLLGFFSFNAVFQGKKVPLNNISEVNHAVSLYFSWFGSAFKNVKVLTTQAIKMDWKGNSTT